MRSGFLVATGGTTLANVAATGVSALAGIVMTRGLGPEGRGQVAIVLSWFAVVQAITEVGLSGATVYFVAKYPPQTRQLLHSIRVLYVIQGTLGALAGIGALHFLSLPPNVRAGLTAAFILMPFVFWIGAPLQSCQAQSLRKWNLARIGQATFYLLSLLAVLQNDGLSVVNVTVAFLAAAAFAGFLAAMLSRTHQSSNTSLARQISYRRIYSYAIRNWAWTVLTIVGLRLDQLTLSLFVSSQQLGLYVTAVAYMALAAPFLSAIAVVTFTTTARGSTISLSKVRRVLGLATATSIIAAATLAVMAPRVLPLIFGQSFAGASRLAILLAAGTAGSGIKLVAASLLLGSGRPSTAARLEAIYVLCLGGSLVFGVLLFGTSGAAISFSIVTVMFAGVGAAIAASSQPRMSREDAPIS